MTKNIIIVDDQPVFRLGLNTLINTQTDWCVVGEAAGVSDGLTLVRELKADIVILDLSLADGSGGLQMIKSIRNIKNEQKILVASMHDDLVYAERALKLGAHGYINKAQAAEKMIEAISEVLNGGYYVSKTVSENIMQCHYSTSKNPNQLREERLSNRELEIFSMIGRGIKSRIIAQLLQISPRTVDSHRENIKKKLGLGSGNALVQRAVSWVLLES